MKHAFAKYSNDLHYVTQILSCNFKAIHMQSQICSTYFIMIICSWERLGCFLCVFAKDLNLRHTWILCFNLPLERHPYLSLSLVMLLCLFFQWWIAGKLLNWSIFSFILLKILFKWVCFFKRKNAMRYIKCMLLMNEHWCCVGCTSDDMDALINLHQSAKSCPYRRDYADAIIYTLPADNIVPM